MCHWTSNGATMRQGWATTLFAVFLSAVLTRPAEAQVIDIGGSARGGVAFHAAGFTRTNVTGSDESKGQHRVIASGVFGASLRVQLVDYAGLSVDADYMPRVRLDDSEGGVRLGEADPDEIKWLVASAWAKPGFVCGRVCLTVAVGYGRGWYEFSQGEQRGDIVNPVAVRQDQAAWRFALNVAVPELSERFSLTIADYVATVEPYYSGERLSALHMLLAQASFNF